ncbi:MAG: hypothetical protein IKN53_02275, partial [Oscillibacter sp.]|nr:hypothetical protein [Oscillibacter sp.]
MRVSGIFGRIRGRASSIFSAHLLLMSVMLAVALAPLAISNRMATRTLTEYYGKELEMTVRYRCDELSTMLFGAYAIPNALQGNQYYDALAEQTLDAPTKQYAWMLPRLSTALA